VSADEVVAEETGEVEGAQRGTRPSLKRVPVVVRSWDGPNSRLGLELDLAEVPWGPFDALGKRLSLLLPFKPDGRTTVSPSESQVERALRHVEHASDRCGEFAQISNGNQELWLRSRDTWEWIRRYLTDLWVETELNGGGRGGPKPSKTGKAPDSESRDPDTSHLPSLPHAAATLRVAAQALRATPLATWRESAGPTDLEAPTREEAVQTLLGVARILSGQDPKGGGASEGGATDGPAAHERSIDEPAAKPDSSTPGAEPTADETQKKAELPTDPDQVSFDFARGYDDGYQMGRRVGLALGTQKAGSRNTSSS